MLSAITLALVLGSPHPRVSVTVRDVDAAAPTDTKSEDSSATARRVASMIRERVWEEGFALTRPAGAAVQVEVELAPATRIHVRGADGRGQTAYLDPGPAEVRDLELMHRVVEMVEATPPRTAVPDGTFVRVELHGLDTPQPGLRRMVHDTIVRGGAVVAAAGGPSDQTLCIWSMPGFLHGETIPIGETCGDTPGHRAGVQAGWSMDEPVGATVDRLVVPLLAGPIRRPSSGPNPFQTVPLRAGFDDERAPLQATRRAPSPPSARVRVGLGARAGVGVRAGGVDPLVGIDLRAGRVRGFRGLLTAEVMPSRRTAPLPNSAFFEGGNPSVLRFQDWILGLGPALGLPVGERGDLEIATVVGPLVHHYSRDPSPLSSNDAGTRVDFAVTVPATAWIALGRGLNAELGVRVGVASRPRSHELDGTEVWSRGFLRFGATLGFRYDWSVT